MYGCWPMHKITSSYLKNVFQAFVGWISPSGRNPPDAADGGLRGYAANPPYTHF